MLAYVRTEKLVNEGKLGEEALVDFTPDLVKAAKTSEKAKALSEDPELKRLFEEAEYHTNQAVAKRDKYWAAFEDKDEALMAKLEKEVQEHGKKGKSAMRKYEKYRRTAARKLAANSKVENASEVIEKVAKIMESIISKAPMRKAMAELDLVKSLERKLSGDDGIDYANEAKFLEAHKGLSAAEHVNLARKYKHLADGVSSEENESKRENELKARRHGEAAKMKKAMTITTGAGSRGGNVVSYTKNGNPVYGQPGDKTKKDDRRSEATTATDGKKTPLDSYLHTLTNGATLDNAKTSSGKPVLLRMEDAKAHGYDAQDHKSAADIHYELHQRWLNGLEKYQITGHKIPESAEKVVKFHKKKFIEHFKAAQTQIDRMLETKSKTQPKADAKVKKSITSMGHEESPDINTGRYAEALAESQKTEWLGRLQELMADYEYGDSPRVMGLDKGKITLVKVAEGEYTGFFTKMKEYMNEDSGRLETMEDTEKIRIERITLPDLVQLMQAKEYIVPMATPPKEPETPVDEPLEAATESPMEQAQEEPAPSPESDLDKKIHLLELVNKLVS